MEILKNYCIKVNNDFTSWSKGRKACAYELKHKLELEKVLSIFENPVRRELIKRLSQELNYSFQLAKDTGLSQQQIANHLSVMEEAGIVDSSRRNGFSGQSRRVYRLNKSFSLVLDAAPHMYNEKIVFFLM
jgi:predicted transcriptional regulator